VRRIILKEHITPAAPATAPGAVVLCQLPGRELPEAQFATWWRNDEHGGFSVGHYFRDYEEAAADYEMRVGRGF
jgi:hypothetical protein